MTRIEDFEQTLWQVSPSAFEWGIKQLREKLNVHSRIELMIFAQETGAFTFLAFVSRILGSFRDKMNRNYEVISSLR